MDYMLFLTGYDPRQIEPALAESCQPVMYTLPLKGVSELSVKVVKSKHACVELPELDIRILPGQNSRDLICDVYGLLSRIEEAIKIGNNVDGEKRDALLIELSQIKEGRRKATLVLTDPSGLSIIMGEASKDILNT